MNKKVVQKQAVIKKQDMIYGGPRYEDNVKVSLLKDVGFIYATKNAKFVTMWVYKTLDDKTIKYLSESQNKGLTLIGKEIVCRLV